MTLEDPLVILRDPDYYPLDSLQTPLIEVEGLVQKCVEEKVGNSVILLGNRSRGPIAMLKKILKDAEFKTVWLNGDLLNDSYSILKHLSWHFSTATEPLNFAAYEQFAECLEKFASATPIVFVLEELDQFAMIPGQNLLYTLFEAPMNQRLPVLVIGVTEKYDVVSMMEKRVKSRFSQHVVAASEPDVSFDGYTRAIKSALCTTGKANGYNERVSSVIDSKPVKKALYQCFMQSPNLHYSLSKLVGLVPFPSKTEAFASQIASALMSGLSPNLSTTMDTASVPMIMILIAIKRLEESLNGQQKLTFECVADECFAMLKFVNQNRPGQSFTVSQETLQLAWCSLVDAGILNRPSNSWISQSIDVHSLVEPLTNLYQNMPSDCAEYLKELSRSSS